MLVVIVMIMTMRRGRGGGLAAAVTTQTPGGPAVPIPNGIEDNKDNKALYPCPVAAGAECQPCPSEHGRFVGCPGKRGLRVEVDCGGQEEYPAASVRRWENRTWVECHSTSEERERERRRGNTQVALFLVAALAICCASGGYLIRRRRERFAQIFAYSRV